MPLPVPLVKPIRLHQVLKLELDYVHAQILCNPVQLTLLGKDSWGEPKPLMAPATGVFVYTGTA